MTGFFAQLATQTQVPAASIQPLPRPLSNLPSPISAQPPQPAILSNPAPWPSDENNLTEQPKLQAATETYTPRDDLQTKAVPPSNITDQTVENFLDQRGATPPRSARKTLFDQPSTEPVSASKARIKPAPRPTVADSINVEKSTILPKERDTKAPKKTSTGAPGKFRTLLANHGSAVEEKSASVHRPIEPLPTVIKAPADLLAKTRQSEIQVPPATSAGQQDTAKVTIRIGQISLRRLAAKNNTPSPRQTSSPANNRISLVEYLTQHPEEL
jgi:hypothetical protein